MNVSRAANVMPAVLYSMCFTAAFHCAVQHVLSFFRQYRISVGATYTAAFALF